ncbi:hypothetical protein D3C85_1497660 [compost metagenome]
MLFIGRAQVALVDHLHALLAGHQGQADDPQRPLARADGAGHQGLPGGGEALGQVEDQAGVHQHGAVGADQRRGLDQRIDLLELRVSAEHRKRAVFEWQSQALQRDCDAADIG